MSPVKITSTKGRKAKLVNQNGDWKLIKEPNLNIQPIPLSPKALKAMFQYFGYAHQVQDMLRCLSKDSRVFARSHHMVILRASLKIHRLFGVN